MNLPGIVLDVKEWFADRRDGIETVAALVVVGLISIGLPYGGWWLGKFLFHWLHRFIDSELAIALAVSAGCLVLVFLVSMLARAKNR